MTGRMFVLGISILILTSPIHADEIMWERAGGLIPRERVRIGQLDADGTIRTLDAEPKVIPGNDLIALTRIDLPQPPEPTGPHLVFRNGDCWPGRIQSATDTSVEFIPQVDRAISNQAVRVSMSQIAVMWFDRPQQRLTQNELWIRTLSEPRRRDTVLLANGDRSAGILGSIDAMMREVRLRNDADENPDKAVRLPLDQVVAIALNTELTRIRKPSKRFGQIVTRNGGRWSLASYRGDLTSITGELLIGGSITIPWSEIVSIRVFQGSATYLHELKPSRVKELRYLDLPARWQSGRSLDQAALMLRRADRQVDVVETGLSIAPGVTLNYPLGKQYRRLEARIGIADDGRSSRELADAVVEILIDGVDRTPPAWRSIRQKTAVESVIVDVTGAREMTLRISPGRSGIAGSEVHLGDARLVK